MIKNNYQNSIELYGTLRYDRGRKENSSGRGVIPHRR